MANLYQSADRARKIFILILIFFIGVFAWNFYSASLTPVQQDEVSEDERFYMFANRIFGDLPSPAFSGLDVNADARFAFESVHGAFPDVAYVYQIEEPREKLLTFERALNTVSALGFIPAERDELDENTFEWERDSSTKVLRYNKQTQVWEFNTDFLNNPAALARKEIFNDINQYLNQAPGVLSSLQLIPFGMANPTIEAQFAALGVDGDFVNTTGFSDAEYIFLNYFRRIQMADLKPSGMQPQLQPGEQRPQPIDAKVYSDDPRFGQISMVVSNQLRNLPTDIFRLNLINFEYLTQETNIGAYIIISPEEAWNLVQQGQGSLALLQAQGANLFADRESLEVSRFVADFRRTELAYFEPKEWQGYAFPVFVFRGRAELKDGRQASFVYYVDAIKR